MNWTDSNGFFQKEICGRWPSWEPTEIEKKDWCRVLGYYAKDIAKEAMFNYVKDANRITQRPLIAVFITKAKLLVNKAKMPKEEEEFRPEPGRIYGKPARDKVFTAILNGAEGKTKRWLVDFLKANPTKIPIGATLPVRNEARGLADDSVGSILRVTPAFLGKPNPEYDENYKPPDDDIPF